MAKIVPFKGIRYNAEKVHDLSLVAVPPYDVILPPALRKYMARHPKNFIYLTLGKQGIEKNKAKENYEKAAKLLHDWLGEGTLRQEQKPCFYVYEETFVLNGEKHSRTGIIALLGLAENDLGQVLKHEKTMEKPFEDRMLLLEATKADLEPIFLLYEDKGEEIEGILRSAKNAEPIAELIDDDAVEQRVWLLADREEQEKITEFFKGKDLMLADGHHRYATALSYMEKHRNKEAKYKMIYLTNVKALGLKILATHRALLKVEDKKGFLEKIGKFFSLREASRGEMFQLLEHKQGNCFGLLFENKYYFCVEKDREAIQNELEKRGIPTVLQGLPTTVLHSIVFETTLNLNPENIVFEKSVRKLVDGIEAGRLEAAFFLKPTSLQQFEAVAKAKQLMPPKSTYFYPKPLSGLVFYKLE